MKSKLKKALPYFTAIFIGIVCYLLYQNLSSIKWDEVGSSFKKISNETIVFGGLISGLIYFILSSYDYLSVKALKIKNIRFIEILPRSFVCYAFNLNLGSLVGGLALRYRLYSKWKMPQDKIPYLILMSTFTNWSGYLLLMGVMVFVRTSPLQKIIPFPALAIKGVGGLILLALIFYLWACFKEKEVTIKDKTWKLPKVKLALVQFLFSSFQWTLQSVIIYLILTNIGLKVSYTQILFTFMLSSIATVFTHIPAGLGVLEVVFMRMKLGIPHSELLVGLIAYRVIYYIVPLLVALPVYGFLELKKKKGQNEKDHHSHPISLKHS